MQARGRLRFTLKYVLHFSCYVLYRYVSFGCILSHVNLHLYIEKIKT